MRRSDQAVPNIPLSSERQPLSRDRRARDIATQAFELLAFMRLARHPGMQREPSGFRDSAVVVCCGDCWHCLQSERLAPLLRAERDNENPAAFAAALLSSAAATAGTVCKVNALRP